MAPPNRRGPGSEAGLTPKHTMRVVGAGCCTQFIANRAVVAMIALDLDRFRARILQDALTEATAQYWIHRAHQFQQAAPRLDEYRGQATRDELNQRWLECMATSQACLNHAELITGEYPEPISDEVWTVLGEVA